MAPEFRRQLEGYGLTTAEILYRLPDHPAVIQTFVWQDYDLFPRFPVLTRFLDFWRRELEGPLYSVRVAHQRLIRPSEVRAVGGEFRLNCPTQWTSRCRSTHQAHSGRTSVASAPKASARTLNGGGNTRLEP